MQTPMRTRTPQSDGIMSADIKMALVDTNYPWYGGAAVYKKIYIALCISPYIGHIWRAVENKIASEMPVPHSLGK